MNTATRSQDFSSSEGVSSQFTADHLSSSGYVSHPSLGISPCPSYLVLGRMGVFKMARFTRLLFIVLNYAAFDGFTEDIHIGCSKLPRADTTLE